MVLIHSQAWPERQAGQQSSSDGRHGAAHGRGLRRGAANNARLHQIPTVITCAAGGPGGPTGPLLPEITEVFPDVEPIYRTKINSWQDDQVRSAIQATGRRKVIYAGIADDPERLPGRDGRQLT